MNIDFTENFGDFEICNGFHFNKGKLWTKDKR